MRPLPLVTCEAHTIRKALPADMWVTASKQGGKMLGCRARLRLWQGIPVDFRLPIQQCTSKQDTLPQALLRVCR